MQLTKGEGGWSTGCEVSVVEGSVRKYQLWEMIVKEANGMYSKSVRWSSDRKDVA